MIVDDPLPPAPPPCHQPASIRLPMKPAALRGEWIPTAEPLFMDAETCRIDAARDAMRPPPGRQKAMGWIIA